MLNDLLHELRRRRVPQVAGFYLAAGWIAFEVAEATFPRLGLPDWTVTFVLVLLLLAFPLVVGLAWLYDVTPDGVRRTREADAAAPAGPHAEGTAVASGPAFGRIAVTGAIAVLALAGGAFILFGGDEPEVALEPNAMVVLPFTVRGGEDVGVLAEGMVELLSAKLDGVGELRSADPHAVLSLAAGGVDAAGARRLARQLGAAHYVLGSVLEFGGELRLQASIYDTGTGQAVAEASVEGADTAFLALVDDLAGQLLVAGELAPPGRIPRLAALTTESLPALKHFLEGERALRLARYDDAIGLLQRAVETDTAFALAYYRMSVAASWAERPALRGRALDAAQRHGDRLGDRDRALVAAWEASKAGRHVEAERRYREILASYPDDLEAWYELGEVLLHRGAFLGVPLEDAEPAFERALELDPGHASALFHLSNIAAWRRDMALLESTTRTLRERRGGDAGISIEAQWAFARGDSVARARAIDRIAAQDTAGTSYLFAAWGGSNADAVLRLMALAEDRVAQPYLHPALAQELANYGQRDRALAWLDARDRAGGRPPVAAASLATDRVLRTPPETVAGLRSRLEAWDPGPVRAAPLEPDDLAGHDAFLPHLRLYLMALAELRLGHGGEALGLADSVEALGGTPEVRVLARDFARHVRAEVALDAGNAAEALRIIEASSFWEAAPWDERFSAVLYRAGPITLRAETLFDLGLYREAIRWYSVLAAGLNRGHAHYRQAQAYEALGETGRAAEHYARFVEMWAGADPDLQDRVADARRRLAALAGEG